ncbi:rrf2 family transcriptional regulator [Oscillochloris trichoides DG-6]|uniref:Rrf2 family transcriptional regulator n=1 Tax=Oscillochloris trichoides DG-6 TaxID=765420 RepID=E1IFP5_9CHLR|nr:Rrf2 family transcriptional regulator [Oscillochloris trichoides]EFO79991.1 rrf2 family transcriptional regulator [Oscillochloris trichoides DG-6]
MRISNKGDYALRALFDLAQHIGRGPIQSDEIATRQGIPVNYLNHLLISLRKAGLIESLRGSQGGHLLARSPESITLLEIFEVVEGQLLCAEPARDDLIPTVPEDRQLINDFWVQLRQRVEQMLAGITLDDLCQRKQQCNGDVMYYI